MSEMPEPTWPRGYLGLVKQPAFTADQMRAYAEAAIKPFKELMTLYQHSAMTDSEFVLKMDDLIYHPNKQK
jgi:hypothetical protein